MRIEARQRSATDIRKSGGFPKAPAAMVGAYTCMCRRRERSTLHAEMIPGMVPRESGEIS